MDNLEKEITFIYSLDKGDFCIIYEIRTYDFINFICDEISYINYERDEQVQEDEWDNILSSIYPLIESDDVFYDDDTEEEKTIKIGIKDNSNFENLF